MNKPWRRVAVHGPSMLPTLQEGDRLLVVAWPRRLLRRELLVAARTPERVVVKRVAAVRGDRVDLVGDNPAASTDYPDTPVADVLGRVVYRYAPTSRAGRL